MKNKVDIKELYIERCGLRRQIFELKNENAELKKDKEYLDKVNNEQTEVILKLQAQIDKMKCCENCKKHRNCECLEDKKFYARIKRQCDEWELAE